MLVLILALVTGAASTPNTAYPAELVPLSADEAIAAAVNDLKATTEGYRLRQPRQVTTFTPAGLAVIPASGGPAWTWQLATITAGDRAPGRD
jgi:hypothetical protein